MLVLLTPLQAAGEEYAFRGYLMQAFGGLFRSRWVAWSRRRSCSVCAHGLGQSAPIFFDRFAFGIVAGSLVVLTGGLEAGIAMHVLNNWLAFGLALAFGDMGSTLNPTGGSWWTIPVTLTQSLVYLGLALRRRAPDGARRTAPIRPCSRPFWPPPAPACKVLRGPGNVAKGPCPLGYGVIGSTTGSGPVSLGSSPSTPAKQVPRFRFPEPRFCWLRALQ